MTKRYFIVSLFMSAAAALAGDFTVEAYWQLGKARLELAALEWQSRIDAAEQAKGDRKMFLARSEAITKEFSGHHSTLHSKFETTPAQYLRFGSDHAREVDLMLEAEENRELKNDVQGLRDKVQGLMQRYDAVAAPMLKEDK